MIGVPLDPVSYSLAKRILMKLPPAIKHYVAYAPVPLGLGVTPPDWAVINLPSNNIVVDISVLFQLLVGETQTVQILFGFSDGFSHMFEISASSTEGATVEKRLSAYQFYVIMGGRYPGPQGVAGPRNLVSIWARARTNLTTPGSTQPSLFARYCAIE